MELIGIEIEVLRNGSDAHKIGVVYDYLVSGVVKTKICAVMVALKDKTLTLQAGEFKILRSKRCTKSYFNNIYKKE